ncbi:transcription factor MafG-like [Bolinopsis microptera]|uniref:transcription factor MafG-like n=1 Tax=Bolinopsis microptera TaxID=2820187 RepID=UPI003079FF4F
MTTSAFQMIPPRPAVLAPPRNFLQFMQPWNFTLDLNRVNPAFFNRPLSPPEPKSFTPKLLSVSPTLIPSLSPPPKITLTPEILNLLRQQSNLDQMYKQPSFKPLPKSPECATSRGPMDISTLVNLSIKDLNKQLRGMNRTEVVRLKQLRRRLKNRTYAKLSRHKRVATISVLEEEITELEQELACQDQESEKVSRNTAEMNQKLAMLLQFADQHNIKTDFPGFNHP